MTSNPGMAPRSAGPTRPTVREKAPKVEMTEDIYWLPEGKAILKLPGVLSKQSKEEIEMWIGLMQKKLARIPEPAAEPKPEAASDSKAP